MPRSTPAISSSVDGPSGRGLQRHVGHPLDRHVAGGVGERAAVGPAEALQRRHPPVELVADQDAVRDDVPLLAGDALVVVADRGQAVLDGPVAGDVHHRRAVLQGAELVEGGERGAGVVGLVAERPVQLGGVPDRLVDGQPQVGRVDDQVVAARLDRRAPRASRPAARAARPARPPSPSRCRSGTPSRGRPAGASVRIVSNRPSVDLHRRRAPDAARTRCWVVVGAGRVGVELVLLDLQQRGVERGRRAVASRPADQSASSATLSAIGTSNGSTS